MFSKLHNRWFFDDNESLLIKRKINKLKEGEASTKSSILIQAPFDYYYLSLYGLVINKYKKEGRYNYVAVFPEIFSITPNVGISGVISFLFANIDRSLRKRKWKKLYRGIGVEYFCELNETSFFEKLKSILCAFYVWKKLSSKSELLSLELNRLKCGDLIYDTYLRYRVLPTVNVNDKFLLYLIYQCINVMKGTNFIADKFHIKNYFTSYTSYIQHGVIVRNFKLRNIDIYTSGNFQQRFKKLKKNDLYHTAYHHNYSADFKKLNEINVKLAISRKMLSDKFAGKIDQSLAYMKKSSFAETEQEFSLDAFKNDGVLFLHDFFDSPHIYGDMLFVDFYEWVIHTINLIIENNLNIAIKPHPNQVEDSKVIISSLMLQFPRIQWIDPKVSNRIIMNSGIKFGISIYGTVLHELVYHGIHAISAGENPHSSYEFVHNPKSIDEYDYLISNHNELVLPDDYKTQVESFYYMHNVSICSDLNIDIESLNDFNQLNSTSKTILQILPII